MRNQSEAWGFKYLAQGRLLYIAEPEFQPGMGGCRVQLMEMYFQELIPSRKLCLAFGLDSEPCSNFAVS